MSNPLPGTPAPALAVDLVGGGRFKLADAQPERFTMVVFYRGKHCPVCKSQLKKLEEMLSTFTDLGVEAVAVSMDTEERASGAVEEWGIKNLRVGHGVSEDVARSWGLYMSTATNDGEPDRFSEPGLFLVRPDGTLYYAAINSMPFGRPDLEQFKGAIEFVIDQDYPARGIA